MTEEELLLNREVDPDELPVGDRPAAAIAAAAAEAITAGALAAGGPVSSAPVDTCKVMVTEGLVSPRDELVDEEVELFELFCLDTP